MTDHTLFGYPIRVSQLLCNDRCQNILYKAVFEHFKELKWIAALLLTSKSFQNSSFGANFILNFAVDFSSIDLFESILSPSSCFSLQFVPSLHVKQSWDDSGKINRNIFNFVGELVCTKYLQLSLRSLTLTNSGDELLSFFFGSSSNSWPQLHVLTLAHCGVDDAALEAISEKAVYLRAVTFLASSRIKDAGLKHIAKLTNINSLGLSLCRNITDVGLNHVTELSSLTSIDLSGNLVTDAGLEHVSHLSNLTSLDLSFCNTITDAVLERISKLSNMTSLNLANCVKITDAGLEQIAKLSNIKTLNLRGCNNITNAGLEHVSTLSRIISLDVSFCEKLTSAAKKNLKAALPNLQVTE